MWQDEWKRWQKELAARDPEALRELEAQSDEEKLEAFAGKMAFGTGGLRSILGMGPARMNVYTVARATEGLSRVILGSDAPKSVAIAYDTRKNSDVFARAAARVFLGNGIRVVLWPEPVPTPLLSYTVRKLGLGWGVVVTASHNPKQYNGYKVYDRRGVQVIPEQAARITEQMEGVDFFGNPDLSLKAGREAGLLTEPTGVMDAYCEALGQMLPEADAAGAAGAASAASAADLPLVYSGLYGTGAKPVSRMLRALGFSNLTTVQMEPDSDFGGLYMPNPEDARVYAQAIEAAKSAGAKLLLATDPDCDRVGVQVARAGGFVPLNGNEIGALLIDYLCAVRPPVPGDVLVTTVVSGELGQRVARSHGIEVQQVLTGFKFIGDVAENLPPKGKRFFFGYEESYGYLTGDLARDKDAVLACSLVAKMALHWKAQGKDLLDRLEEIEREQGYCVEKTVSRHVEGIDFAEKIAARMEALRDPNLAELGGLAVLAVEDYLTGQRRDLASGSVQALDVPRADVLKFFFAQGTLAVRPSGTEPNIKFYCAANGKTRAQAGENLGAIQRAQETLL